MGVFRALWVKRVLIMHIGTHGWVALRPEACIDSMLVPHVGLVGFQV